MYFSYYPQEPENLVQNDGNSNLYPNITGTTDHNVNSLMLPSNNPEKEEKPLDSELSSFLKTLQENQSFSTEVKLQGAIETTLMQNTLQLGEFTKSHNEYHMEARKRKLTTGGKKPGLVYFVQLLMSLKLKVFQKNWRPTMHF